MFAWSAEPLDRIAAALAAGEVTSAELVADSLAVIEGLDRAGPHLNGVISLAPDAREQADAADAARRRGETSPLLGVPVAIKDCIDTADMPTTHGSRLFADWRPSADAAVIARLRQAGAIVIAKVALDDFAGACFGVSSVLGAMRNPYDLGRTVGGSSGGSALAVAAGYVPLSIGTDTGGSLRIPASLCGVVTIRPTVGLVSRAGIFPRSRWQDTAGPMARTVLGAALGLDAIAGYDPADPVSARSVGRGIGGYAQAAAPDKLPPDLSGIRVAFVDRGLAIWGDDPDGPVLGEVRAALATLVELGADVVELPPPPRELLDGTSAITAQARADVDAYLAAHPSAPARSFRQLFDSGAFTEHTRVAFARQIVIDPTKVHEIATLQAALARRGDLRDWTLDLLARNGLDAVAYPSVQQVPAPLGVEQAGVFTRWSEHTGFPAISLPVGSVVAPATPAHRAAMGIDQVHLPVALELLGRPFEERRLIRLAATMQRHLAPPRPYLG